MKTSAALILIVMSAAISSQAFAQGNSTRTQKFSDGIYAMPASRDKASKGSGASSEAVQSLQDETLASELFVGDKTPKADSIKVSLADALASNPDWYNETYHYGPSRYGWRFYNPWYYNPWYYDSWYYGYSYYPYPYWGGPYYGAWAVYYDPWTYSPWRSYDYAWLGPYYGGPWYGPYYGPYFTPYGCERRWHEHHHYDDSVLASRDAHSSGRGMNSAGGRISAGPRGASRLTEGAVARNNSSVPSKTRTVKQIDRTAPVRTEMSAGASRAAVAPKGATSAHSAAASRSVTSAHGASSASIASASRPSAASSSYARSASSSTARSASSSAGVRPSSSASVRSVPESRSYSGYSRSSSSSSGSGYYSGGASRSYSSGSSYSGSSSHSYSSSGSSYSGGSYSGSSGGGRSSAGSSSHGGRR